MKTAIASTVILVLLASQLTACEQAPQESAAPNPKPPISDDPRLIPNAHYEALQNAEAVRHTLEERKLNQDRLDELLDSGSSPREEPPQAQQ